MALKIFVDFDGAITQQDVGNLFFRQFGGEVCAEYVADYRAERISAKDLFREEVEAIGLLDVAQSRQFLHQQEIDISFKAFAEFCRLRNIEMHIVSDGLDYYIREVLSHHGLDGVSFFANHLEAKPVMVSEVELLRFDSAQRDDPEGGFSKLGVSFPYDDAECTRCACCKRNLILNLCSDDDIIVYVGEGYSDRCPAQHADIVFAKADLQKFCQKENISYFLYNSFGDVVQRLEELLAKKRLKPRREAVMKRREAFMAE